MSWSDSTGLVQKSMVQEAIDQLVLRCRENERDFPPAVIDQVQAAGRAAIIAAMSLPGPFVIIGLSGHANGVGWQKLQGVSSDTIHIAIAQVCDEDLRHYTAKQVRAVGGLLTQDQIEQEIRDAEFERNRLTAETEKG